MSKRNEEKRRITRAVYDKAQPHKDGKTTRIIWDLEPGLGLRVRPNGTRAFVYVYRFGGKPKWVTLKGVTDPDSARALLIEMKQQRNLGKDPGEERKEAEKAAAARATGFTVASVLDKFIEAKAKKRKPKTVLEYKRVVEKVLKPEIGKIKVDALDTPAVKKLYEKLMQRPRTRFLSRTKPGEQPPKAETQAAGAIVVLRSAMSFAIEEGFRKIATNPAKIKLPVTRRRDWCPTIDEVARLLSTTDEWEQQGDLHPQAAVAIRLLFSTGCRISEICNLKWEDIDGDLLFMRLPGTKTGYLRKAISSHTREILESAPRFPGSPWVCPGISDSTVPMRVDYCRKQFRAIMKAANVVPKEYVSLHMARHWFATEVASNMSLTNAEKRRLTGHKTQQAFEVYEHAAEERWNAQADQVADISLSRLKAAMAKSGNVVPIRGGK